MYPFPTSTTIAVSGTTSSGKTSWTFRLLEHLEQMFEVPPRKVLYCYSVYQDAFQQCRLSTITFRAGLPSEEDLEALSEGGEHTLVVLDDLMRSVTNDERMERLFTEGAHHRKTSVLYLNQNLYFRGKHTRTINLNTHFLILMRNPRDTSQIQALGRQVFPGQSRGVWEAYKDATHEPYGYLVLDLSPQAEESHRLRTNIFPGERTVVYQLL